MFGSKQPPSTFNPARKRYDKKNKKQNEEEEKQEGKIVENQKELKEKENLLGSDEVIKIFEQTPLGMLSRINLFQNPEDCFNILDFMTVECSC